MKNLIHLVNTLCLLTAFIIIALCYWARTGLPSYVSGLNYIGLFSLASTIFILPDFLCRFFTPADRWYRTSEFYTLVLIIFLAGFGQIVPRDSSWLVFLILPFGIFLAVWEIWNFIRIKNFLILTAGLIFTGFLVVIYYARAYVSPLFTEQIIFGNAHVDTLFLSSMSNMFSTMGYASTGLDGATYVPYHYGSLVLFGGLMNWIGLNSLMFLNLAYPAIFIPLFLKSLFYFLNRLFIHKGYSSFSAFFAFSFLMVFFSMKLKGLDYASPFKFESLNTSLIFTFFYSCTLLVYVSKSVKNNHFFFLYSLIVLLLISSFKISTGVVCIAGTTYLYLRSYGRGINNHLQLVTGLIVIAVFYFFIFPSDRLTVKETIANRITNLWDSTFGFIIYLSGALLALFVVLKQQPIENWKDFRMVISSKKYLDMEILFIITVFSFMGGIFVSSFTPDVYMFCIPQFFISVPFLIMFSQLYFDRFAASSKVKGIFLFLLMALSFTSRPDIVREFKYRTKGVIDATLNLSPQQEVLRDFIGELSSFDNKTDKKRTCIYIPNTEKWFYFSQSNQPLGQRLVDPANTVASPMIVPAISGIALIGGISDSLYNSDYNFAGFYFYKKECKAQVKNLDEAKARAIQKGYSKLLEYQSIDNKLVKQTFILNK